MAQALYHHLITTVEGQLNLKPVQSLWDLCGQALSKYSVFPLLSTTNAAFIHSLIHHQYYIILATVSIIK